VEVLLLLITVTLAIAIAIAVVQASFFEWAFHRFWLHRPWLPESCFTTHTLIHHQLCKYDDTFHVTEPEQEEALTFQWWGGPVLITINVLPWALVAWGLTRSHSGVPAILGVVTFAVTFLVYYIGYESLHYLMHKPRIAFIENSAFFRYIKRHHAIHHVRMNKNLNVVLPIADFCLGSLVREMPVLASRPTGERAKLTARQYSRFGRQLREEEQEKKASGGGSR
jgi:hypothetical protein